MTSGGDTSRPVDLDLLADYVDGLLPARPAAAVERRIATDPRWAAAARQLRSAAPAVADVLRARGAATEPMPDAVFERILAALPDPAPRTAVDAGLAASASAPDGVPGDRARQPDTRTSAGRVISLADRRRRPVWSRLAKAAAALVVLAGLGTGIGFAVHGSGSTNSAISGAANQAAGASRLFDAPVTASGRDYGDLLRPAPDSGVAPRAQSPQTERVPGTGQSGAAPLHSRVPAGLERLDDHTALNACLGALVQQFGTNPTSVDFAFYRGRPAVVVGLADAKTVAVGAQCGLPDHGADVIATGR